MNIGRLRKLLNPGDKQDPIRTVRSAGHALDDRFAKVEQWSRCLLRTRRHDLHRLVRRS